MEEFGKVLKRIRQENNDSLRSLGEKINVVFTYIDKIEKGISPINRQILEKLIQEYPLKKDELMLAYLNEVVPESEIKKIKKVFEKNDNIKNVYQELLGELSSEERKDFFKDLVDKLKVRSWNIDSPKEDIEEDNKTIAIKKLDYPNKILLEDFEIYKIKKRLDKIETILNIEEE